MLHAACVPERVWGKCGASANRSTTQIGGMSSSANMAGGKRAKDIHRGALGWLCPLPVSDTVPLVTRVCWSERLTLVLRLGIYLQNKLRPGSISRIDPREDGKLRTSNVTKYLASCSANGLPPEYLFLRDDIIKGTTDCLARFKLATHSSQTQLRLTLMYWLAQLVRASIIAPTPLPTRNTSKH
jgi:hypothetical protein